MNFKHPLPKALKRVKLREQNTSVADEIAYAFSLSPLTSRILSARGFLPDDRLKNYLVPTLRSGLPEPSTLKNLGVAADTIVEYGQKDRGIAVACDFDVDGLSSGALIYDFLKKAGIRSHVYVPDRFAEGYGLNERIITDAKKHGYDLLLTLDYGTTNIKELEFARAQGLFTIVVDHHHVMTNPPADIFVNPHQEGCGFADGTLCAAGLAWYLTVALNSRLKKDELNPKNFLDLACLGTICDMVPLQGPNRIIARRGLECLEKTERPGLVALKNVIGIGRNLACSNVSFGIGPRLNAAGRMVSGDLVIELLTTTDTRKADKLARKLHRLNKERQDTEALVKQGALSQVYERYLKKNGELPGGIVVWNKEFHTGVIGIVAQRMVEQFYRPAAVLGFDQGKYKGSVRGIPGVSVIGLLQSLGEYLLQFGGHEGAGGFSLEEAQVEDFAVGFDMQCRELLEGVSCEPSVQADTECDLGELTPAIVRELKRFEPLGVGNPGPQLLVRSLEVKAIKILKDAHMKVSLSDGKNIISGMIWRTTEHPVLQVGRRVNVVGKADLNTFYGHTEMQMNLQAIEPAS